jgi:GNAT superfamily N-acetyltransferase
MADDPERDDVRVDLAIHRAFPVALGGYALELAGGVLVTHERIAVPAFNYVDVGAVGPDRQTAFFERALDHYFQRAIRPTFRCRRPVPTHLDRSLGRLGFAPRPEPWAVLVSRPPGGGNRRRPPRGLTLTEVREGRELAPLWAEPREADEFARSLEILFDHPNPGEHLEALVAHEGATVAGGALIYERGGAAGIHAVATQPSLRGRGVATAIVAGALARAAGRGVDRVVLLTAVPRLGARLAPYGLREVARLTEYHLPPNAALAIPPAGPPAPPRWRPPRSA